MKLWTRVPVLCAAIVGGVVAGWLARTHGATHQDAGVAEAAHRGQGDRLVEYFDPACEGSRVLHRMLDEEFGRARFEQVLVPVAIGRGAESTAADALCALPAEQVWQQASAWARTPPRHADLPGVDPAALQTCADTVEAATRYLATITGTGEIVTPVAEFRGRVYRGPQGSAELMSALRGGSTP